MEMIFDLLHSGISGIMPFIILLGLLIFVHEAGHFFVARFFGVRVEVFSLGFGKKIFQFRRGDTTYCLSLIPLGGYVKMFGDEVGATISDADKPFAFNFKPPSQRFAIALAGPVMNLLFAIILFLLIGIVGEQVLGPVLGDISGETEAYKVGFRSGDKIIAAGGEKITSFDQFNRIVERHSDSSLTVEVEREGGSEKATLSVTPSRTLSRDPLNSEEYVGEIPGISFLSKASMVGVSDPNSPAGQAGFKTGDVITQIGTHEINFQRDLISTLKQLGDASKVAVKVARGEGKNRETLSLTLEVGQIRADAVEASWEALGFGPYDLFLYGISEGSAAQAAGLKAGDRFLRLNGEDLRDWDHLVNVIKDYKPEAPPLKLDYIRDGKEESVSIVPKLLSAQNLMGQVEERYMLGISRPNIEAAPTLVLKRITNPVEVVVHSISEGWHWTYVTVLGFVRIFQNKISAKSLGGPISIGQMANKTFQMGLSPFLKIMAIISINLFVLNLLPIPILDGGHLVFSAIEMLRGAPLSMRKLEIAQQIGLVLILGLILFSFFNDIARILKISW